MLKIGITEYSDPIYDRSWEKWALEKREPCILITKNFTELIKQYPLLLVQDNIIVHATITGYGGSFVEPGVSKPQHIIDTLRCNIYKERVVIRIDPIIPIEPFIDQSRLMYEHCKSIGYKRFRISIMDLYPHVIERLEKEGYYSVLYDLKKAYMYDSSLTHGHQMHAPLTLRKQVLDMFPDAEICGEPGVKCTGCISRKDLELLKIVPEKRYNKCNQREFCQCLGVKKELLRSHNCEMGCLYCYWKKNN